MSTLANIMADIHLMDSQITALGVRRSIAFDKLIAACPHELGEVVTIVGGVVSGREMMVKHVIIERTGDSYAWLLRGPLLIKSKRVRHAPHDASFVIPIEKEEPEDGG